MPLDLDLALKRALNETYLNELFGFLGIATSILSALWGCVEIDFDTWVESGVLQCMIVADSEERKSFLLRWLLKVFNEYQNSLQKQSLSKEEYNFYKKVYLSTQKELIVQTT